MVAHTRTYPYFLQKSKLLHPSLCLGQNVKLLFDLAVQQKQKEKNLKGKAGRCE